MKVEKAVDLGADGNQLVLERFEKYLKGRTNQNLTPVRAGVRRVLVSGFGLFKGTRSNISGALIRALSSSDIYSATQSLARRPSIEGLDSNFRGIVQSELGVDHIQREITIDGQAFHLSLLNVDVQWDFASAVIVSELMRFEPDALIMMGQGANTIIFESGARNLCNDLSGFTTSGEVMPINTPVSQHLVDQSPDELMMNWSNTFLAEQVGPVADTLGFEVEVPPRARDRNTYICNNVAYNSLLALQGEVVALAGGQIRLEPKLGRIPKAGFLHLPIQEELTSDELSSWIHLLNRVIFYSSL